MPSDFIDIDPQNNQSSSKLDELFLALQDLSIEAGLEGKEEDRNYLAVCAIDVGRAMQANLKRSRDIEALMARVRRLENILDESAPEKRSPASPR